MLIFASETKQRTMAKNNPLKRYLLDDAPQQTLQFELLRMPHFFCSRGKEPYRPHIHAFYQIVWFVRGSGNHFVDFKAYEVSNNTLFLIAPGQVHNFEPSADAEGIIVHFNADFLSDENSGEDVALKYDVFNALERHPRFVVDDATATTLHFLAHEMEAEMARSLLFAHADYLKGLLKLFLIAVKRYGRQSANEPLNLNNTAHQLYLQFRRRLESDFRRMHAVKEYANRLNVSTKTLTNAVATTSHTTLLRLINERITLEAKRLLRFSHMQIKEVGFALGFEDPSYFVKFFKRQTGMMPAQWRKLA